MLPADCVLADGTKIHIRAVRPDDAEALRAGFENLSARSRYQRFLGGVGSLSPAMLDYLTNVDGVDHVAIAATRTSADLSELGIAHARFVRIRDRPTVAEAAITVADEMQGRGVGRAIADCLAQLAIARGIEHFRGEVLVDNEPCRQLLRDIGAEVTWAEDGRVAFDIALRRPDRRWPEVVRRVMRAAASGNVGSRLG